SLTPMIRAGEIADEDKPMRAVFVSRGFIDLANRVSHAKAIDRLEKGYYLKYVTVLAESGDKPLGELPGIRNSRYWTDDIMNAQRSYFNQIVATSIAIKLAHHYL